MISVIIPTYNEKKNISRISKKLSHLKIVSEVIFVDDNSSDGTYNEIKKLRPKNFFFGYSRKAKPRDLSRSVIYGVKKSKKNIILVMDCDLQHDAKYIKLMLKKFQSLNCDILIASRFLKKRFSGNLGITRSIVSNLTISLINFVFGKKTSDPLSGFFVCKKNIILNYKSKFFLRGYKILFDIIYNGNANIKIKDLSIVFKKRNFESSKFNFRIMWLFLMQMLYTKIVVKK